MISFPLIFAMTRDLFDLWYSLTQRKPDIEKSIQAFKTFMDNEQHTVSRKNFNNNLKEKIINKI